MVSHLSKTAAPEIADTVAVIQGEFILSPAKTLANIPTKPKCPIAQMGLYETKPFYCKTRAIGSTQENPRLYS